MPGITGGRVRRLQGTEDTRAARLTRFQEIGARRKATELVLEQIRRRMLDGAIRPGDRLPPERQLTEQLGVSRTVVREALSVLEALGLVSANRRSGRVMHPPTMSSFLRTIALVYFANAATYRELFEARKHLESAIIRLTAERRTPGDLRRIQAPLDVLVSSRDLQEIVQTDIAFHFELARASHNEFFSSLLELISDLLGNNVRRNRETLWSHAETNRRLAHQHLAIFRAVRAGDPGRAAPPRDLTSS
jgi:GntR family transcriptional repressor for pyruvate dehydrogenase complex